MDALDEEFDTGLRRVLDRIQFHVESRSELARGTKSARTRRR